MWVPDDDRRDSEVLYNPTTVGKLKEDYPQVRMTSCIFRASVCVSVISMRNT